MPKHDDHPVAELLQAGELGKKFKEPVDLPVTLRVVVVKLELYSALEPGEMKLIAESKPPRSGGSH